MSPTLTTSRDHFHAQSQGRLHVIELIMAVHGRSTDNPKQYRDWLVNLPEAELKLVYLERVEQL